MTIVAAVKQFDYAAWALVVVSLGLLVTTIVYAWNTRNQVQEMKAAREIATAPNVVACLDIDHRSVASLVVKNIGKGIANNIRISIDPPLVNSKDREFNPMDMNIITKGIISLLPGQEIKGFLDMTFSYFADDLPDTYTVELKFYGGIHENIRTNTCYLDFRVYRGLIETPLNTIHELVKAVEKIAKTK